MSVDLPVESVHVVGAEHRPGAAAACATCGEVGEVEPRQATMARWMTNQPNQQQMQVFLASAESLCMWLWGASNNAVASPLQIFTNLC